MKCNTQMYSCKSAVTLYWRRREMKCTSGHLQGSGYLFFFSLQDGLWGETDWDDVGWATAGDWCNVTSWRELRTLAGAAVIVSVLGAELASSVGEAAGSSSCATEALGMKASEGEKNEYRNLAKKLSCRRSYSLFKAMLGNLLAVTNDSEWILPPNWLKLSISKVIQSCSAKLNTAQLCLLTRLVCISIPTGYQQDEVDELASYCSLFLCRTLILHSFWQYLTLQFGFSKLLPKEGTIRCSSLSPFLLLVKKLCKRGCIFGWKPVELIIKFK